MCSLTISYRNKKGSGGEMMKLLGLGSIPGT